MIPAPKGSTTNETVNVIMKNNCTTCANTTERVTATGRTGWHCILNDIDVNSRMGCEEHEARTTMTQPPVFATSISSSSTQKIRRH